MEQQQQQLTQAYLAEYERLRRARGCAPVSGLGDDGPTGPEVSARVLVALLPWAAVATGLAIAANVVTAKMLVGSK